MKIRDKRSRKIRTSGARKPTVREQLFNPPVEDAVFDTRLKMKISRQGRDRGEKARDLQQVATDVEGRAHVANRLVDALDRMLKNGSISRDAFDAAREFQRAYDRCGHDRMATTNFTGSGGGDVSKEDIMARTADAQAYCQRVRLMLGGAKSPMWQAIEAVLGQRSSLSDFVTDAGRNVHYWSGMTQGALHLMAEAYQARMRKVKRE